MRSVVKGKKGMIQGNLPVLHPPILRNAKYLLLINVKTNKDSVHNFLIFILTGTGAES